MTVKNLKTTYGVKERMKVYYYLSALPSLYAEVAVKHMKEWQVVTIVCQFHIHDCW